MAVYGYCRVSTDRQAEEGESLGTQQRQIEGYALQHGWELTEVHVERGVSGGVALAKRPEGQRLLARLQPGDIVITPKIDRMFRKALDGLALLEDLQTRKISLHMINLGGDVTGNGVSKLVFTILAAVAEGERDAIRDRIREVKRDQRAQGHYLGGIVRFGWQLGDDGKTIVEKPAEQVALAFIRRHRAEGASIRTIQKALRNELGLILSVGLIHRLLKEIPQS